MLQTTRDGSKEMHGPEQRCELSFAPRTRHWLGRVAAVECAEWCPRVSGLDWRAAWCALPGAQCPTYVLYFILLECFIGSGCVRDASRMISDEFARIQKSVFLSSRAVGTIVRAKMTRVK